MPIDISIVIPTLNRSKTLKRVIEALIDQTYPKDKYEIVIVDDGCTDDTAEMVRGVLQYARTINLSIVYIHQDASKRGPAGANNLGIKTAKGEYILMMNDDVIADRNLVKQHVETQNFASLRQNNPQSKYGIIVQGRVINTSSLEDLGKKHDGYSGGYSNLSFGYFTTWNCSLRKNTLIEAGLFDEDFRDLCWEDVEFGFRLRRLGVKQIDNKNAFGYHFRHVFNLDQIEWVRTKSINMGKNGMIYYRKHPILEVKISTESFWLPMAVHGFISIIVKKIGKQKIINYFKKLKAKKKDKLLAFLVGLAGKYWYWSGVKAGKLI